MDDTKLAGLIDLPNELLKLIVDDLSNYATYNLAMSCKGLHYCVLPILLDRNGLDISSSEHVSLLKPSKVALRIFARSLFIQNLRSVSFYPNADLTRLLSDLRTLRQMVAYMPELSELTLQYSSFDWLINSTRYHDQVHLDMQNWRLEFAELLDAALAKSCKRLLVSGANHFSLKHLDHSHQTMNDSTLYAVRASVVQLGQVSWNYLSQYTCRRLLSMFWKSRETTTTPRMRQSRSTPAKTKDLVTKPSSPNFERSIEQLTLSPSSFLTTFHVHSQMLLQPPLLSWTQSRLQLSAATLTDLSFNVDSISLHSWNTFLPKLKLPALSEFEITCDQLVQPTGVHFSNIVTFLIRHASITVFHLYGLIIPCDLRPLKRPILPRLTRLTAHPSFVAWLFTCNAPIAYQAFPCVTITSEFSSFKYDLFDGALIALARHPETDMNLCLRFVSKHGVLEWMQKHISLGHSGSCVASLSRVRQLSIFSYHSFSLACSEVLKVLPPFLALFPGLEDVNFAEELLWVGQLKTDLVKEVKTSCPRLKTFSVNALPIGL